MLEVFKFMLALIIETIMYCTIPIIIRVVKKKPLSKKASWYISLAIWIVITTIDRILAYKVLNATNYTYDFVGLLLTALNIYILRYDKNNKGTNKKNVKTILKILGVVFGVIFAISLIGGIITLVTRDKKEEIKQEENKPKVEYVIKNIKDNNEFEKVLSKDKYTIVIYDHDKNPFHQEVFSVLQEVTKDYKLEDIYYCNMFDENYEPTNYCDASKAQFELEGYPTVSIYKDNSLIAKRLGSTLATQDREEHYRDEIVGFLFNNGAIK